MSPNSNKSDVMLLTTGVIFVGKNTETRQQNLLSQNIPNAVDKRNDDMRTGQFYFSRALSKVEPSSAGDVAV